MAQAEYVMTAVPKAWYKLDEWILFFTTHRIIVTRFMAWGSAMGGVLEIVGMVQDENKRKELMNMDPNILLANDDKAFEIHYHNIKQLQFKSGFFGSKMTYLFEDGSHMEFKLDSQAYVAEVTHYLQNILAGKIVGK